MWNLDCLIMFLSFYYSLIVTCVISGMMVQDPKKPKDVDALFEQARLSAVDRPVEPSRSSASTSFTGASRMLSGEPVPPSAPQQQQQQQQQDQPQLVMHTITFWRNGFTVDDGPLRRVEDPENADFMDVISFFFLSRSRFSTTP